jgi:hypothetical protein
MSSRIPIASLSLDLDNEWSYLRVHGDAAWKDFPSYLGLAVPRILDFLKQRHLRITFFVVGQDAALEKNREPLAALAAGGHEIGNHSFHHQPWLHLFSEKEIEAEFALAEEHIERATGCHTRGFRGPGYSLSEATLRVLVRRGYRYDASTLPTIIGPLARVYYFLHAKLDSRQKNERGALFGTVRDGFRPLKPYRWRVDASELIEIPVTTMPLFRVPFHLSYLLYLSGYSRALALSYFRMALALCRATGTPVSLLLHPLDFLGKEDVSSLSFFPGMNLPAEQKLALADEALGLYTQSFQVVSMEEHARHLSESASLAVEEPRFHTANSSA